MAKRHAFRPGEWETVAHRLDEIISAHSGEDPFSEAKTLLVAKLTHESAGAPDSGFLAQDTGLAAQVDGLLAAAQRRWPGIVEASTRCRLSDDAIARCAEVLRSVHVRADDLIGLDALFECIVSRAAKGQKGQFFTPRHVVAEIVRMLQPEPGDWVVDPACGSGGFLHHALRHAPNCQVFGFDADARAVQVARILLSASGQPADRVQRVDSLLRRGDPQGGRSVDDAPTLGTIEAMLQLHAPDFAGFDLVLTNPPFAGDVGDSYAAAYELAQGGRVERDVLFVERCVGLLKPGGRLAMVLPHNKFSGQRWAYLRRWALAWLQDVAVISLGRNTFQPHTSQKACVLIGRKRHRAQIPQGRERVLFFISERDGKDARGRLIYRRSVGHDCPPGGRTWLDIDHDLAQAVPLVQRQLATAQEPPL